MIRRTYPSIEPRSWTRSQARYSLASETWTRSSALWRSPVSRYAVRSRLALRASMYAEKSASRDCARVVPRLVMLTPDPPRVVVIGVPPSNPDQDADAGEEVAKPDRVSVRAV